MGDWYPLHGIFPTWFLLRNHKLFPTAARIMIPNGDLVGDPGQTFRIVGGGLRGTDLLAVLWGVSPDALSAGGCVVVADPTA